MQPYEIIEHTADIGVRAYGHSKEELFAHMAEGMFSLIVPLEEVKEKASKAVSARAEDEERLLIAWLRELLFLFDTEHFLGKDFQIRRLEQGLVEATISGETLDLSRHHVDKEVKAATYCELTLTKAPDGIWSAQVIFDI